MEQNEQDFWDMRSQDGRDKIFADAALLWENARAYFKYCTDNPLKPLTRDKGDRFSTRVRVMTISGLCLYLGCSMKWFEDFKQELADREGEWTDADKAMWEVIDRIEQVIDLHKYNNAVAGLLNVHMVMRDMGMTDKKDSDNGKTGWDVSVEGEDE